MTKFFIVGGAGFIGSHLLDALVAASGPASDDRVTLFDNLSVGKRAFVESHLESGRAQLIVGDALETSTLEAAMAGHDVVFHLAANPEARWGLERTRLDLEQGTIATYNVLESMRKTGTRRLVFASSGTVYGPVEKMVSEGDLGELPISLYGASKLAGEALISSFAECFGLRATIMRFGNVVGPRGTHGALLDFLKKLKVSTKELEVLGDGRQSKPYLHVSDCVRGLLFGLGLLDRTGEGGALDIFNLAPPDQTTVAKMAELAIAISPYPKAAIRFTGGEQGWKGDVPRSRMSPDKLAARGFKVSMTSDAAVRLALEALAREVFD